MSQNPRVIVRSPKKDVSKMDFHYALQASTTQQDIALYTFPDKQTLMGFEYDGQVAGYDGLSTQVSYEIYIADAGKVNTLDTSANRALTPMPRNMLVRKWIWTPINTGLVFFLNFAKQSKAKRKATKGQILYLSVKSSVTVGSTAISIGGHFYVGE